ncbi:MAG TPA: isoprenylcysteine carboxylmethyltransferase family protein [Rhizomicrobium sp.]|nr:isoprenylcysteine carboxylmethyltransferase family protein [Rhizomicrobium sp.]
MSEASAIRLDPIALFDRHPKVVDLLAAVPLIAWYAVSLYFQGTYIRESFSTLHSGAVNLIVAMSLLAKVLMFTFGVVLICLMVIRRTPLKRPNSWTPRFIAFLGAYLVIGALVMPLNPPPSALLAISTVLILGGTAFALYSLLWLGRSISIMPESRKLVTSGPYSLVRHPLYLGEQTVLLGVALQCTSVWPLAVLVLQLVCQLYRMSYEEKILAESFPEYTDYARHTARILPWIY